MKLLWEYIRQHGKSLGLLCLFALILIICFLLYHVPIGVVLYPLALCLLVGFLCLLAYFNRFRKRHLTLEALRKRSTDLLSALPPPTNTLEADYQQIIEDLCRKNSTQIQEADARYDSMMEYYTVWAHQIKTPLAASRLLLENEDSSLSRQLMVQLKRTESYVEMVLAYLRLDSADTDYLIRACSLDELLRGCVRSFSGEFIQRHIHLELQETNAVVVTDEKWLSFVMEQLLSNALKYTGEGGTITVKMEADRTLCIADTGIGIAAEDLPRVFERSYTGSIGRNRKKATGIGLYLCRRVCGNLNIPIRMESEPGKGTRVYLGLGQYDLKPE